MNIKQFELFNKDHKNAIISFKNNHKNLLLAKWYRYSCTKSNVSPKFGAHFSLFSKNCPIFFIAFLFFPTDYLGIR